jgi:hypothetical protein
MSGQAGIIDLRPQTALDPTMRRRSRLAYLRAVCNGCLFYLRGQSLIAHLGFSSGAC